MEKLVKLLNEYHFSGTEYIGYFLDEKENRIYFRTKVVDKGLIDEQRISDERIISKKFGFIKWLIYNDKIDIEKIENSEYYLIDWFYYNERKKFGIEWKEDVEKILLMLLSTSDNPIDFLCEIIKK